MTLRELFAKTPFDSIVPYIKRSKQPNDVPQYKQAYDILLHTTPYENGCWDVYVDIKRNPDGTQWVRANELEGYTLNRFIDGSIIIDDGEEVCNELLAFCLLWEITFHGYTPEDRDETFRMYGNDDYHDNIYGRMAAKSTISGRYYGQTKKSVNASLPQLRNWKRRVGIVLCSVRKIGTTLSIMNVTATA